MPDEKVLDVPAIDMTDAGLAKRKPAKRAAKQDRLGRARWLDRQSDFRGREQADRRWLDDQASRLRRLWQADQDPARNRAANYYRVARAAGTVKPRKRRAAATSGVSRSVASAPSRGGRPRSSAGSDLDARLSSLVSSIQDLATALKQERAETADLRRRLDGLRALV